MNSRIREITSKTRQRVAGLMSGTSADGVDVAIADISSRKTELLAFAVFPYSGTLRREILRLCRPESATLDDICHYNFVLGEVFADAIVNLCRKSGISLDSIDLIGSHGQTIYHNPRGRRYGRVKIRSTLQIGEPSIIAERTGITTVADFRPRDMAVGGEGAPLVPFADYYLFRHRHLVRAVHNIGGIANVTFLPANCAIDNILAFDTGPGNMIIDAAVAMGGHENKRYDRDGKIAATGTVNRKLLNEMLRHPFLRRRPPKSTGREEFGADFIEQIYQNATDKGMSHPDIVATVTAYTAVSIAGAYHRFLPNMPDEVVLCGGGAHNNTLIQMLRKELSKVKMLTTTDFGIDVDAKEAVSFAVLAWATLKGIANNVPGATGAEKPVVLGKIIPA